MVLIIDKSIKKQQIQNKGYGYVAIENIPKGTTLIQETPEHQLDLNQEIYSDIFQLLYIILTDEDTQKVNKFHSLTPSMSNLNLFLHFEKKILEELEKLKSIPKMKKVYKFFKDNYTSQEILLFCSKYISNAFSFSDDGPVMLYTGAMLNHSCLPNVIFGKINEDYYFISVRNIQKGEEICDNYCDITLDKNSRQKYLLNQYGFKCGCLRCTKNDKELDKQAKQIEIERVKVFGFTKSKNLSLNDK